MRYVWDDEQETWVAATTAPDHRIEVGAAGWPMKSEAMGVVPLPGEVERATKEARDLGVPTEFDRQGFAVLTSEGHRRRLAKALGQVDRNCFNF